MKATKRKGKVIMKHDTLGEMIQKLRKEKRLTQKELADQLGVTDKAVSKWERDKARPDTANLPQLAEMLDVSVIELLNAKIDQREEPLEAEKEFDESDVLAIYDDQERKQFHFIELIKTLGFAMIAFFVSLSIMFEINSELTGAILGAILFATLPSGWSISGKMFSGWIATGFWFVAILLLRVIVSVCIGIVAFPLKVIIHFVNCCVTSAEAKQAKSKQCEPKGDRSWVKAIIVVLIAAIVATALTMLSINDRRKEEQELAQAGEEKYVETVQKETFDAVDFDIAVLKDEALQNAQKEEEDINKYGWEITEKSHIEAIYFMKTEDVSNPHFEILKSLEIRNAILIVTDFYIEEKDLHEWRVWVYPNFVLEDGALCYSEEDEFHKSVSASTLEEVKSWLLSEYDEMTITEM